MFTLRPLVVLTFGPGLPIAACGGNDSGGGAHFDALRSQYLAPTGSLTVQDVGTIGNALNTQSASRGIPIMGAKPHVVEVTPASIDQIATQSGSQAGYACPGGGTESVNPGESSSNVVSGTMTYSNCTETGGALAVTMNGNLSFAIYQNPEMEIVSGNLAITGAETFQETFNYAEVGGKMKYLVTVSTGSVVLDASGSWNASTRTGSFTVTDKVGTWGCKVTSGAGACSGPGGTLTVDE